MRAGADVHRANHFGGTCLINSVQSPELVKFLVDVGKVNVNAVDVQNKTALHYAIQVLKYAFTNCADKIGEI